MLHLYPCLRRDGGLARKLLLEEEKQECGSDKEVNAPLCSPPSPHPGPRPGPLTSPQTRPPTRPQTRPQTRPLTRTLSRPQTGPPPLFSRDSHRLLEEQGGGDVSPLASLDACSMFAPIQTPSAAAAPSTSTADWLSARSDSRTHPTSKPQI